MSEQIQKRKKMQKVGWLLVPRSNSVGRRGFKIEHESYVLRSRPEKRSVLFAFPNDGEREGKPLPMLCTY